MVSMLSKPTGSSWAIAVVAVIVFALMGQPLWAQQVKNFEQFHIAKPPSPPSAGTLEAFRLQLLDYYADLLKLSPFIAEHAPPDLTQHLSEAQQSVPLLTHEELSVMYNALGRTSNWREWPKTLLSVFQQLAEREGALQGTPAPGETLTSHGCPGGAPGGIRDWFIARGVAQGLAFLVLFAPSDLVAVAVVAGIGGGGTVSAHPVKIALQVSYEAAQAAALVVEGIEAVNEECEQNNSRAIIHNIVGPRVDVTVSSRASEASLNQHDADIKARLGKIDGSLAEIIDLLLTPQGRREGFPKK